MRSNQFLFWAALSLTFFLSSSFASLPEDNAVLTVEITNIKNTRGVVQIGLYKRAENFPKPGKQYKMKRIKPKGKTLKYQFSGLKPGKYAVAIYHDENGDKVCNRNLIGVPTEAYAFSRNFRPSLSTPRFNQCYVSLKKARTISIKLVY